MPNQRGCREGSRPDDEEVARLQAARLHALMDRRGITIEELAEISGEDLDVLQAWADGTESPPVEVLATVVPALALEGDDHQVLARYLVGRETEEDRLSE